MDRPEQVRRLGDSSSAISKNRFSPDFPAFSRSRIAAS